MDRRRFSTSPVAKAAAVVGGAEAGARYRFTVLTDGLLRYEWADDGVFEDRASAFAIHRDLPVPEFRVVRAERGGDDDDGSQPFQIITARFHLRYDGRRFSPSGLSVHVRGNVSNWKSVWRFGDNDLEDYPLGGTARTLDMVDGRTPLGPGVISRGGFAELDDSTSMLFTVGGGVCGRREGEGRVDGYLFAYGLDYKAAVKALYAVSGPQPLLPRWALGNWWSRYYKYSAEEYLALIDRFREERLPFAVAVLDMDWHLVDDQRVKESGFSGWTGYSWNKKLFPKPKAFIKALHARGLRVCANDHPADGVAPYEDMYEKMAEAMGLDPEAGDPIPFDIASKRYSDAYFDVLLRNLEEDGMDFWWVDWQQGPYSSIPGVDPLWLLNHFHFLNNARGMTRPLTFSRFAGPGSHRYPIGFSGDTIVTWESLAFQPEFTATSSNIGYGWWSHDIGGHMGGYRDDELATRWVQLGVFSPILRLHSSNNYWNSKEPWRFVREARDVMNEALRYRHKLIPYLYSMNVRAAKEGEPLVQPVYWEYPERKEAYAAKNTFFFGSQMFVAPLTSPRSPVTRRSKVRAWLPPGRYVDVFSGVVYDGDRMIWLHRKLGEYAVFAKEGAIFPTDAVKEPRNGAPNPEALEVTVVVGADGEFHLYEDDGSGRDLDEANLVVTPLRYSQAKGTLTVGPAFPGNNILPEKRDWTITFVALHSATELNASVNAPGWSGDWDLISPAHGLSVTLRDVPLMAEFTISIHDPRDAKLAINDPLKLVVGIIDDAQMLFDPKKVIWAILSQKKPLTARVSQVVAMDLHEDFRSAISEMLFADSRAT